MARNFDDTPLSDACPCGRTASGAGKPHHLDWDMLRDGGGDGRAADGGGRIVEIDGWMAPFELAERYSYFLLVPEMICCVGCLPAAPHARLEVFAARPIAPQHGAIRLRGRLARLHDDPAGYVHQLREASLVGAAEHGTEAEIVSRRGFIGGLVGGVGAALTLAACSPPAEPKAADLSSAATSLLAGEVPIDIHSHAGQLIRRDAAFRPVAGP